MSDKLTLVHGWNPDIYNRNIPSEDTSPEIGWQNRKEFIQLLGQEFELDYYNLPGFCNTPEPQVPYFDVEDFADGLEETLKNNRPKAIIGYSFGGAVALVHKIRHKDDTPIILVSPAVFRGESAKSALARQAKQLIPNALLTYFKHLYQAAASPYYRQGTDFLRTTYDIIVRRDLRPLLHMAEPGGIFMIYGLKDQDTPWHLVENDVEKAGIDYHLITEGGHNIGYTHPQEIVDAIKGYLAKTE